jgi:hypothetical protein
MPTKTEIQEFSERIMELSLSSGESIMDTIVSYCEKSGLEIDVASTLVSSAMKSKIREEAQELNLLKKTARLPV